MTNFPINRSLLFPFAMDEFIPPDMGEMVLSNQNSVDFIGGIASQLDERTLFFLDAHWYNYCPLLDELAVIARHRLRPAVIAIHDFVTGHPDQLGYDCYQSQPFTLEWINSSKAK
jgi:hypothetical protein